MTDLPDGFRQTPLGPLPEEWEVVRLGEVCETPQYGFTAPAQDKPVGPRFLRITDIQGGQVNWATVPYCECPSELIEKYALRFRDLLFARTGSVGKAYLVTTLPEQTIFASYLIRVRVNENKVIPEFAYSFMQSALYWQQIASQVHGAVQPNVNATQLRHLLLPLPPLPEQRAISHVLRTVQQAREATQRVIAAARELKRALMRHLFTYGPVPLAQTDQVELRETEVGPVPGHWEVMSLGQIAAVKGGKRLPKGHAFSEKPTPFPYIRVTDFANWSVDVTNLKYLTPEDREQIKRYIITTDDVYISIAGTIGLVGTIPASLDGANLTENAARIIIQKQERLDKHYLVGFLASEVGQRQIATRTTKTSQPKLALARIQQIPIPLPPLSEQREIARILGAVDAKIAAEEARREALGALFHTLLHHLMTGKVRVPVS